MIKVYQYGCLEPKELPDEALEQLRLANQFWNKLVEIHKATFEKNQELWQQQEPIRKLEEEKQQLETELEEAREQVKKAKQAARSQKVDPGKRDQIANLRARLKEVRAEIRETKASLRESIREQQSTIWQQEKDAINDARQTFAASGLYWGHYNAVLRRYQVASKKVKKTGGELRFHRFDGVGTWTVQIQTAGANEEKGRKALKPVTMSDLFDPASRVRNIVRVDPVDFSEWRSIRRGERRRRDRTTLHLRVGSTPDRQPIWVHLPMKMDRPMPDHAQIKQVELTRRRKGRKYVYTVSFTVDMPDNISATPAASSAVAVHFGWRKQNDQIRSAVVVGDDGYHEEILLPVRLIGGFAKADRIKSERDKLFNDAIAELGTWMDSNDHPDWLDEATEFLGQWRSHRRLMRVVEIWFGQRFDGDEDIWDVLSAWRKRERHLEDFEVNLRDQLTRYRREIYRVISAKLANKYKTLIIDDTNFAQLGRHSNPEVETSKVAELARSQKRIASPSVLRGALTNAFVSRGREVITVSSQGITRTHAKCGNEVEADYASDIQVYCPHCDEWYDQDVNTCRNLLGSSTSEQQII